MQIACRQGASWRLLLVGALFAQTGPVDVRAADPTVRVPLVQAMLTNTERVPPDLAIEIVSPARTRFVKGELSIDWEGDGRDDVEVKKGQFALVMRAHAGRDVPVLVFERIGRGWMAPAALLRSDAETGWEVELLDADQDGVFDGPADRVRVGPRGAFFTPAKERRLAREEDLFRFALEARGGAKPGYHLVLTPETWPEGTPPLRRSGLAAVNAYRSAIGLAPVTLDVAWSDGCQKHAEYIQRNPVQGFGHVELPTLPGFTPEGEEAAREGVMERTGDPAVAVERLTAMLMHRMPFQADPVFPVGVGAVGAAPGKPASGPFGTAGFSVLRGGRALTSSAFPVFAPGPGQIDVPLTLNEEMPTPEPQRDLYASPRGYGVSVAYLSRGAPPPRLSLRVLPRGQPVACRLFTPAAPLHPDFAHNYAAGFLVPEEPLALGTAYEAECRSGVGAAERIWIWRFRTVRR